MTPKVPKTLFSGWCYDRSMDDPSHFHCHRVMQEANDYHPERVCHCDCHHPF